MPSRKETQYKVRIALKFEDRDSVKNAMEVAKAILEEHSDGCVEFEGGAICLSDNECQTSPFRAGSPHFVGFHGVMFINLLLYCGVCALPR